jgi:hypothetical protein
MAVKVWASVVNAVGVSRASAGAWILCSASIAATAGSAITAWVIWCAATTRATAAGPWERVARACEAARWAISAERR